MLQRQRVGQGLDRIGEALQSVLDLLLFIHTGAARNAAVSGVFCYCLPINTYFEVGIYMGNLFLLRGLSLSPTPLVPNLLLVCPASKTLPKWQENPIKRLVSFLGSTPRSCERRRALATYLTHLRPLPTSPGDTLVVPAAQHRGERRPRGCLLEVKLSRQPAVRSGQVRRHVCSWFPCVHPAVRIQRRDNM